eukprot:CAMPEP_0194198092 /NCGR_PEP_ID=MMETSP0154-20130528/77575_1 /TAXON_ID=1049557 /ORGANISM="Thalassiothrix antarctica, Strain L6-D1" /LENGTH=40 /DNA_ID= /DNA_START= /DNA_END= /DNA_ORIENTATION=
MQQARQDFEVMKLAEVFWTGKLELVSLIQENVLALLLEAV